MAVDQLLLLLRFALAALLYAFLAVTFYVMWRGLRPHATEGTQPHVPATLIAESKSPPEPAFTLRAVTAIGRADDNHLVVEDAFASAHHAMVVWRDDRWWVEDLDSHNGTYLNGERINEPTVLNNGDRIEIGKTLLRFRVTA